jgi:hypothetical protein
MLADTACPICGDACKLLLPITAGDYAFSCIIHHDFEVTKAGMEQNWAWCAGKPPCLKPRSGLELADHALKSRTSKDAWCGKHAAGRLSLTHVAGSGCWLRTRASTETQDHGRFFLPITFCTRARADEQVRSLGDYLARLPSERNQGPDYQTRPRRRSKGDQNPCVAESGTPPPLVWPGPLDTAGLRDHLGRQ